jgi:ABC-type transporter lipoprotein component MlaA
VDTIKPISYLWGQKPTITQQKVQKINKAATTLTIHWLKGKYSQKSKENYQQVRFTYLRNKLAQTDYTPFCLN